MEGDRKYVIIIVFAMLISEENARKMVKDLINEIES